MTLIDETRPTTEDNRPAEPVEKLTKLREQDPLIADWMKSRDAFLRVAGSRMAIFVYRQLWRLLRLLPGMVYLAVCSPVGFWNLTKLWYSWVRDLEVWNGQIKPELDKPGKVEKFGQVNTAVTARDKRVRRRWLITGVLGFGVFVAALMIYNSLNIYLAAFVIVQPIGWFGRPERGFMPLPDALRPPTRLDRDTLALAMSKLGLTEVNKAWKDDGVKMIHIVSSVPTADGAAQLIHVRCPVKAKDIIRRGEDLAGQLELTVNQIQLSTGGDKAHPNILVMTIYDKPQTDAPFVELEVPDRLSVFEKVSIGKLVQTGERFWVDLVFQTFLIVAHARMGKTFLMRAIGALASRDDTSRFMVYDFGGAGELNAFRLIAESFYSGHSDEDLRGSCSGLVWLSDEISERMKIISAHMRLAPDGKVTPELIARQDLGLGTIFVIMSDFHILTTHPIYGPKAIEAMDRLTTIGQKCGIVVLGDTQSADGSVISTRIRSFFSVGICMRVRERLVAENVLGEGKCKDGFNPLHFSTEHKGRAWVVVDEEPQLVQFDFLDSHRLFDILEEARTRREAAGLLRGHAALHVDSSGSAPDSDVAHRTTATDVREIWTEGADHMFTSDEILPALKLMWPEDYRDVTSAKLVTLLAECDVETDQMYPGNRKSKRSALKLSVLNEALGAVSV